MKIGDRVILIDDNHRSLPRKGSLGTVLKVNEEDELDIKWDILGQTSNIWIEPKRVNLICDQSVCSNNIKNGGIKVDSFKQYLEKHRDVFFTIGIVLVLDHFVFGGAFKEKLQAIVDSFLSKRTKEITNGK